MTKTVESVETAPGAPTPSGTLLGTPPAAPPAPAPGEDEADKTKSASNDVGDEAEGEKSPDDAKEPATAEKPAVAELKPPEGIDPGALAGFKGVAQKLGLDTPKAQALLDFWATTQTAAAKSAATAAEAQSAKWVAEIQADKAFLGNDGKQFDANARIARAAVQAFGGDALRQVLNETGLGDHPAVARAFLSIGRAMAEDKIAGASSGGETAKKDPLRLRYPKMFTKE